MKKIISLFVCLLIILSCTASFAAGVNYTVSPLNLTLTIPESMEVFTRNTSPDDGRFSAMGFGYDTMMESFKSQDIYLQAMSTDAGNQKELVLICHSTDEEAYSDVTSLYNAAMAEGSTLENQGKKVIAEDIFEHGGTDYIVVEYSDVFTKREYVTIQSGMKIRLRLTDYEGDITSDEEDFLENIVTSIKIPKAEKDEPQEKEVLPSDAEPATDLPSETSANDETSSDESTFGLSKEMKDKIIKILISIVALLLLITLPPFIMKLFLFRKGLSRSGAKVFAIIYCVLVAVLLMYLKDKKILTDIPLYMVLIPLLWSYVIYKIVKH